MQKEFMLRERVFVSNTKKKSGSENPISSV
jgi:hypothetical protein